MPRFVVLRHESPRGLHWDFMLQRGETLATWALAREPEAGMPIAAEALPDHRLAYLEYEGPISGGRGTVTRWDWGSFEPVRWDDLQVLIRLSGTRLLGEVRLDRAADPTAEWSFTYTPHRGGE